MSNQAIKRLAPLAEWGSRPELVYAVLPLAILEQALPHGTKLLEDGIGEQLGVSRRWCAACSNVYAAEELVTLEPNRRAAVARPSLEEEHRAVLDALRKRDLSRAWNLMHEHLDSALETDEAGELPGVLEVIASYAEQLSNGAARTPQTSQYGVASNLIMNKDKGK